MPIGEKEIEQIKKYQRSPLEFIWDMWRFSPQPLDEEFVEAAQDAINRGAWDEIKAHWFLDFEKGKHITWQQWIICLAVERAILGLAPKRISVSTGHGIGKDAIASMLVLWYLFCFQDAQVPCTAPSADQLYDVLWKEIAIWMRKMPPLTQKQYEWGTTYVRMTDSPETWFARARTARKENPEAFAGVHGNFVFMLADEASGIDEAIYNTAEGALTNENVLVLLISNWTRLIGYFHDTQTRFRAKWQCLRFDSRESPIVDPEFINGIIAKHGEDSDEFRIRVTGEGPHQDAVDDEGYVPLLSQNDLREVPDIGKFRPGWARLGVDPAGEGKNETIGVVRDKFRAKIVFVEKLSTGQSVAQKSITTMDAYKIPDWQTSVDGFGEGMDAIQELGLSGYRVNAVNTGDGCAQEDDKALFINIRAMCSWRARQWLRKGGELVRNPRWKQCLAIRYRRQLSGKIKVMDKMEMRKRGIPSPDAWDALCLTFINDEGYERRERDEDMSDSAVNQAVSVYNH